MTTIRLGRHRLDLRPAVAMREQPAACGAVIYLSLLDDEIDERVDRFMACCAQSRGSAAPDRDAAAHLELTDAVIVHSADDTIVVMRGGSCTFPVFWSAGTADVRLSTRLPLFEGFPLSRSGCVTALTALCFGSYEPNACAGTPLHGWRRVRRGSILRFERGGYREAAIVHACQASGTTPDEEAIVERLCTAFAAYGRSQRAVAASILELSGGFDSTLAGAAARGPRHTMHGVSAEFPYYEFRFEAAVQRSVAAALDISRTVLDGTQLLPYAPWERPPRFDEPSVFVTGIRHAEQVAAVAAARGATRVYVGHGGDQLFSSDLTALEPVGYAAGRGPFTRAAWRTIRRAATHIEAPAWRRRSLAAFVYDARQDVWVKETFGPTVRTPFSDLAVFRAAQMWSVRSASMGARPDKTILARGLQHLIPPAVIERKGKVAYDGVWVRAYADHGDHIARTFDRASAVLEEVGISPAWLLRRTRQLAKWQPVSDREVLAAYALAAWFLCWGIDRPTDVEWR